MVDLVDIYDQLQTVCLVLLTEISRNSIVFRGMDKQWRPYIFTSICHDKEPWLS